MNITQERQLAETLAAFEGRGPKKMFRDWLLAGFSLGELAGPRAIAAVSAAALTFLAEEDSVSQFVGKVCDIDISAAIPQAELYSSYVKWCLMKGIAPKEAAAFGRRLTDLGIRRFRYEGGRITREGLRFAAQPSPGMRPVARFVRERCDADMAAAAVGSDFFEFSLTLIAPSWNGAARRRRRP